MQNALPKQRPWSDPVESSASSPSSDAPTRLSLRGAGDRAATLILSSTRILSRSLSNGVQGGLVARRFVSSSRNLSTIAGTSRFLLRAPAKPGPSATKPTPPRVPLRAARPPTP